jgi:hypothetical protein
MQFEARELPAYAEVVSPLELKEGSIYFSITFIDEEMLIPTMEAFVYIGRDLEPEDSGQLYFQDAVSHQEGVRYAMAADGDGAQFLVESEDSLYLFEYERALDVLMLCSLRRGEKGLKPTERARGFRPSDELPPSFSHTGRMRSFRFADADLQARFLERLRDAEVVYEVRDDGAVVCADTDWQSVNGVAHTIRDSCFRWYLTWWKDPEYSSLFLEELKASGLSFQVEHHDGEMVFLLPKGSEDLHEVISNRVQIRAHKNSRPSFG